MTPPLCPRCGDTRRVSSQRRGTGDYYYASDPCPCCASWPDHLRARLATAERVVDAARAMREAWSDGWDCSEHPGHAPVCAANDELGAALVAHEEVTRAR